jgi:hypothetical protein
MKQHPSAGVTTTARLLGSSRASVPHMDAEARFNSFLDRRASSMNCPHCRRPFIKIDCYGELLVGCIECNRWGRPGDKTLVMELIEDDLQALKNARKSRKRTAT